RHLQTSTEPPVKDREVEQRRRAHPDVEYVDAGRLQPLDERARIAVGGQPAVASHRDQRRAPLRCQRPERLPQPPGEPCVEVALRHRADVVFAEDGRIQLKTSTEWRSRRSLESQSSKRWPIAFS